MTLEANFLVQSIRPRFLTDETVSSLPTYFNIKSSDKFRYEVGDLNSTIFYSNAFKNKEYFADTLQVFSAK